MNLNWLKNVVSDDIRILFETSADFVPFIGASLQTLKINRLQIRLRESENKLNRIGQLMANTTLSEQYITDRVFPVVLSDLIEEHEDAKIYLILNGFINVFIEEEKEESIILTHFDTLRNLRYMDVRRLLFLSQEIYLDEFPLEKNIAVTKRIDSKLQSLGLIGMPTYWDEMSMLNTPNKIEDIKLTPYGEEFRRFIEVS